LWAPWRLEGEELREAKNDAMTIAVANQLRAGIDVIGDGEQSRQHFVTTFVENQSGIDFKNKKTMRIRDRYDALVPVVVDQIHRERSVFVEDAKFLRTLTDKTLKFTLPGPMTIIDTLFDQHYGSREQLAFAFAEILNEEAKELVAAGIDIIQFDEPAFNVFFDDVRNWGVAALERAASGLTSKTAVHICYGYGIEANIKWKNTLGDEWRQYENIFPMLAKSSIDQISLECQNSKVPMELVEILRGKEIMIGAIDVASNTVESAEDVAKVLREALAYVDAENLLACTNCGMVPLARDVANGKLQALAAGTALLNKELGL
jgi:5-methyltetrahydropteroyltriglutamate--homocysteine methyltransferase